jgi:hypothetical protein
LRKKYEDLKNMSVKDFKKFKKNIDKNQQIWGYYDKRHICLITDSETLESIEFNGNMYPEGHSYKNA